MTDSVQQRVELEECLRGFLVFSTRFIFEYGEPQTSQADVGDTSGVQRCLSDTLVCLVQFYQWERGWCATMLVRIMSH